MAHFEIKNLTFSYPTAQRRALDDVSLSVDSGLYVAICGKSGSGKTTLLRHLKSVLTPTGKRSGDILFEGNPLEDADLRTQSSRIGYVMQDPDNQIVTDKVWHELAFGLESLGLDTRLIRLRVAEMASYFGIQDWFHRNVAELSGGQKQLLNLASIMAMQPSVLILDEPTAQLDPIAAADFLNTVRKINLDLGTTIIITEHRLENIFECADRVVVMEDGRIIASDTPRRAGNKLRDGHNDMFVSLPSPLQIYYALDGNKESPLTVREGRSWLSSITGQKDLHVNSIQRQEPDMEENGMALTLKDVWFRYEKDLPDTLKGVNIEVPRGCLYAVMGGNGTGKTTMLKCICRICRPYRGKVVVEGKKVEKYTDRELFSGHLAMLPQNPQCLFVKKTVREELCEMLSGIKAAHREAETADTAATTEIGHLLDAHPYDLSGGEQQRVALAKVLLTYPRILLLDEPTKGIDAFFKQKLAAILRKLIEDGVTVLMVSHDIEFCARYADFVALFFDGSIMTTGTPGQFFVSNNFYTTAANRMSRHLFQNAITNEEVITLCRQNMTRE